LIATSRRDFLLKNPNGNLHDGLFFVDTSNIDFKYTGIAIEFVGVPDPGLPLYLGSLILKVSANACGTFTIGFVQEINSTFIVDPALPPNSPNVVLPAMQPLILTVSDCARQLLSCGPNHCNVDGRIAHDRLAIGTKLNTDTIEMTFSKPTMGMTAADFEVTLVPTLPGDIIPAVAPSGGVTSNGNKATIRLNRRIQQTRWTVIRDKGSNKRCYMGSLPGEADGDYITKRDDTFEIFENLLGSVFPPLVIEKCDTDRSQQCTPADLIMAVDELIGADAFIEVNGDVLPLPCPPMRPAP